MIKLTIRNRARIQILASLRRATAQAKILNKQLDEMHEALAISTEKKAA